MTLGNLFFPPHLKDKDDQRRIRLLFNVQWLAFFAAVVLGVTSLFNRSSQTASSMAALALLTLISRLLLVTGRAQLSNLFLLVSLALISLYEMAHGEGVHDITLLALPSIMIFASILLQRRGYWVFVAFLILGTETVVIGQSVGLIHDTVYRPSAQDLVSAPLLLFVGGAIVSLLSDEVQFSARRAQEAVEHFSLVAESANRRAGHVATLNRVGEAIAAGPDLNHVLQALYHRICEVLPADAFYVALYDDATNLLTFPIFYDGNLPLYLDPNDINERSGMAGEVIRRKKTLYVPDLLDPEAAANYQIVLVGGEESRTYLGVPLILQGRVIGILSVQSSSPYAYDEDQIALLEALGTQAAIAIENASLGDETRDALMREQLLNEIAYTISQSLDLNTVLEELTRRTTHLLNGDMGVLALVSADGHSITDTHDYNLPTPISGLRLPYGSGLTWEVAINQRPIRLTDYPSHPRALFELSEAGVKYLVGAPILAAQAGLTGETCLGSLLVLRLQDKEPFDDRNLALLESIAYQAGAAIQNARLYAALHERETILEAATYAANAFISHANWRIVIEGVLQQLGQVTGASHISLFELLTQSDETSVIIRRYMWSAPGIDSPAPADAYLSPGLGDAKEVETPLERNGWERWRRNLSRGLPFYGTLLTLLPNEAEEASRLGVQSLLCVPVFVGDSWWGEIRLDDQHTMRQWSLSEIDGLKIVAGVLGSAIQRQHSDQARLENEALYRRTISAAGAVPYVTRANDDQFAFIGEGIFKLTGFTNQEMDLNLWNERIIDGIMMGEAEGLSIDEAWEMARKGKLDTWNCDYLIRHRDGSLRWISDTALEDLGPDGKWRGSTGIMMDITDRKQAEEVIRRLNAGLEERVRQRTSQLEFSNRELEAANQELEAFAYSVAHDLRAPLRSIDGYSKLLAEDYSPSLPDEARQYLDNTRRAAQRMGQLIDDLLLLSRVTRAEMHIAPVNLSGIALDVIGDLRRQDPQRAVMVTIEPELNTDGDASLLRLALENLLGNAWKFTSRQEQPSIYLGKKIRKEETVFFIKDNGAGFDMKYAHQLFKAFQRLHSIEEFKGSGVGLATVQRVIQRHGGHIWAKATVGEGAVFYFTIKTKV